MRRHHVLWIEKGKAISFTQVGKPDVMAPVPISTTDRVTRARVFHAITEANDLRLVIESTPCTDVMSGNLFETTVTVSLNNQTYHGCGGPLN